MILVAKKESASDRFIFCIFIKRHRCNLRIPVGRLDEKIENLLFSLCYSYTEKIVIFTIFARNTFCTLKTTTKSRSFSIHPPNKPPQFYRLLNGLENSINIT